MKQIQTKELQKLKLDLTMEFQQLCKNENLKFYLAYGTLIGAVREKGFISWDEDMDFCMLRKDFDQLAKLPHNALGEKYFIQHYNTDPDFFPPIIRICINGTYRGKGFEHCSFHKGTFVDIFPLDNAPKNFAIREKQYLKCRRLYKKMVFMLYHGPSRTWLRSFIKKILRWIMRLKKLTYYQKDILYEMKKFSNTDSDLLCNFAGEYGVEHETYRKEWFADSVMLPFENVMLPCPSGYHEILTNVYGDYMTPPDETHRKLDAPSYWVN